MSQVTLQALRQATGIISWKETAENYELDLKGAGVSYTLAFNTRRILDYAYEATITPGSLPYDPKSDLLTMLEIVGELNENPARGGWRLQLPPSDTPGSLPKFLTQTISISGDAPDGELFGPNHMASEMSISKKLADDPNLLSVMEKCEAFKASLIPIAKMLGRVK